MFAKESQNPERFKLLAGRLSAFRLHRLAPMVLLLVISSLSFAGDVTFPRRVQADENGRWTAVLIVTNTDNPMFTNDIPVNSTLDRVDQTRQADGSFRITLSGVLIDNRRNGSITFRVDPAGVFVTETITLVAFDTTSPSCALTNVSPGPPKQIQITVQDTGSGLDTISVVRLDNSTISIPAFTPGDTSPVVITATKVDQSSPAIVDLQLRDLAGNIRNCDPIITVLEISESDAGGRKGSLKQKFADVPKAESFIVIQNGDPGLDKLRIKVNNKKSKMIKLKDNQEMTVDVSSLMKEKGNSLRLTGYGHSGASALIVVSDSSGEEHNHLQISPQSIWKNWEKRADINWTWGNLVDR